MDKPFYTVKEAAEILNLAEQTVRDYLSDGRLVGDKIANSRIIYKEEIEKQLELRRPKKQRGAN